MNELLEAIRNTDPGKTAYINSEESITYGELYRRATEYAGVLKRQGTAPVILYGHKETGMIVSILACLMAGRAYVPVDSATPQARLERIVSLSGAALLLKICPGELPGGLDEPDICTLSELERYACTGCAELENHNTTAYIIFTSGSTGEPKGVPISYENLSNFIQWINSLTPLSEYRDICVLNQANFSFDLSVADLYYSLSGGHTLAALSIDNRIFDFMAENQPAAAVMTPTFMKLCLLNKEFNRWNYALRCVYFCGERLEANIVRKLFDAFPDIKVINAYGPTEAASAVCATLISPEMLTDDILPAGDIDTAAVEISIDNREIVLKGKSVSSGYLNGLKGGFSRKNGINCYRTGDIGFIRDGKLYVQGRCDSQVKYKGYRVELGEIESVLARLPGVAEAAVTAKYDSSHAVKSLRAFVVSDLDEERIRTELKKHLPAYMIPRIFFMDHLPVNTNGKIDRKGLAEL